MKALELFAPAGLVLHTMACFPAQPQDTPSPHADHVRVTAPDGRVYTGPVIGLDSTRLEMFDLNSQTRLTVRSDQPGIVEVYRGQRFGVGVVVEAAGRNALFGAALGLATAVAAKLGYGEMDLTLGETTRAAVTTGGIVGGIKGAVEGAARGEAAWQRLTIRELHEERSRAAPKTP